MIQQLLYFAILPPSLCYYHPLRYALKMFCQRINCFCFSLCTLTEPHDLVSKKNKMYQIFTNIILRIMFRSYQKIQYGCVQRLPMRWSLDVKESDIKRPFNTIKFPTLPPKCLAYAVDGIYCASNRQLLVLH